ncbi:MAG: hypothetical protein IJ302_07310 [Clostridia bacterium]|nr:hypothetical protein [Clostridia bacterium]
MDLLIFSGQSNMEGQTEGCPEDRAPVAGAIEYKYLQKAYTTLQHPAGEDIPPYFGGSCFGGGCMLPDFCRTYHRVRGVTAAAVHVALGATRIDQWMPGTEQYAMVLKKCRAAIDAAPEAIGHIYFIWLQGESDALAKRSSEEYFHMLTALKNALKADLGIEKFGIIRVGYFAECYDLPVEDDLAIIEAQERAVAVDDDFLMLSRLTETISRDPDFINPFERGHYNNRAFAMLGTDAAETLARYANAVEMRG